MSISKNPINPFAEIHAHDVAVAQSIPTGTTYTKVTAFDNNGYYFNCTPDHTNDKITFLKPGIYKINGSFNFSDGTNNVTWRGTVFLNNVEQDNVHFVRKIATAGDVGSASFTGFVNVSTAGHDLDFRVRHDNGGSINVTFVYLNLNVEFVKPI